MYKMKLTSYHVHTQYCDGAKSPEDMVLAAIEHGMSAIGFSGHSMYPFSSEFHIAIQDFSSYAQEIRMLAEKYKDSIQVWLGFEADYIQGVCAPDHALYAQFKPDYLIGSVHYVPAPQSKKAGTPWCVDAGAKEVLDGLQRCFDGDIQEGIKAYFAAIRDMVTKYDFDILGHLDLPRKRNKEVNLFDETSLWYLQEAEYTIQTIASTNKIVEVNTNGLTRGLVDSVYPSNTLLEMLLQYKVPVTVNSDAHRSQDLIGNYEPTFKKLKDIGFTEISCLEKEGWKTQAL